MITKTRFLLGRQCARRLWLLDRGNVEPEVELRAVSDLRAAEGYAVEELALELFPGAVRIHRAPSPELGPDAPIGIEGTRRELAVADALAQPHFAAGDLLAIGDIVEVRSDGLYLWEVKSSSYKVGDVKALYDWDLAFQVHVARLAGHHVAGAGLILIDPEYVRGEGPVVAEELLVQVDRLAAVEALLPDVERELARMRVILAEEGVPDALPSSRCKEGRKARGGNRPSTCGHRNADGFCGRDLPEFWAGALPRLLGARADFATGTPGMRIEDLDAEDEAVEWTAEQQRVIRAVQAGAVEVDAASLRVELDRLDWPVAYIDFEFDPGMAIPRFARSQPYDRVPFQWALCVEAAPGAGLGPAASFLEMSDVDPRRAFAEALLAALPESGSIVAHHQSAETTVIEQLADRLGGEVADRLRALVPRFRDTEQIARAGYYNPEQQSSYSLKKLAPALTGRGYDGLAIGNGMLAVAEWRRAIETGVEPEERERVRAALLEYCGLDAELMHDILERLREVSGWKPNA